MELPNLVYLNFYGRDMVIGKTTKVKPKENITEQAYSSVKFYLELNFNS